MRFSLILLFSPLSLSISLSLLLSILLRTFRSIDQSLLRHITSCTYAYAYTHTHTHTHTNALIHIRVFITLSFYMVVLLLCLCLYLCLCVCVSSSLIPFAAPCIIYSLSSSSSTSSSVYCSTLFLWCRVESSRNRGKEDDGQSLSSSSLSSSLSYECSPSRLDDLRHVDDIRIDLIIDVGISEWSMYDIADCSRWLW